MTHRKWEVEVWQEPGESTTPGGSSYAWEVRDAGSTKLVAEGARLTEAAAVHAAAAALGSAFDYEQEYAARLAWHREQDAKRQDACRVAGCDHKATALRAGIGYCSMHAGLLDEQRARHSARKAGQD